MSEFRARQHPFDWCPDRHVYLQHVHHHWRPLHSRGEYSTCTCHCPRFSATDALPDHVCPWRLSKVFLLYYIQQKLYDKQCRIVPCEALVMQVVFKGSFNQVSAVKYFITWTQINSNYWWIGTKLFWFWYRFLWNWFLVPDLKCNLICFWIYALFSYYSVNLRTNMDFLLLPYNFLQPLIIGRHLTL